MGIEWVVDAAGCRSSALRDVRVIRAVIDLAIEELGLHVLGVPAWHVFEGPGGVTGLVMLTESHVAVHTYPEVGIATFNLYCCATRPDWPWEERLIDALGAATVRVRSLRRGLVPTSSSVETVAR